MIQQKSFSVNASDEDGDTTFIKLLIDDDIDVTPDIYINRNFPICVFF